jgi:hypothetical protein
VNDRNSVAAAARNSVFEVEAIIGPLRIHARPDTILWHSKWRGDNNARPASRAPWAASHKPRSPFLARDRDIPNKPGNDRIGSNLRVRRGLIRARS